MENTEKRLWPLFDFQRFTGSRRLDELIRAAGLPEDARELSDDEPELNAAGEPEAWRARPGDGETPWAR